MRLLSCALRRLWNVLRWGKVDGDLTDEVESHIEMAASIYRAQGMSARAARGRALHEFGGERWVEASRSTRGIPWLQEFGRDLRYATRVLRRAPGFTLTVVLTVALGVGATTAVFTVVRGVILAPLPYGDASRLYGLLEGDSAGGMRPLSYPTFEETAAAVDEVADLSYIRGDLLLARRSEGTMNLLTGFVSPNFFDVMQAQPDFGRLFSPEDENVAVLSYRLAERLYGSAQMAVGRALVTPDRSYAVIGVVPSDFTYPAWADLWVPLSGLPAEGAYALTQRDLHVDSDAIARLKPGVSIAQAQPMISAPIANAAATYPEPGSRFDRGVLTPLRERVVGDATSRLGVILGAVVLVLLLVCVNVAGLLLARGLARREELTVRLALGAGQGRVIRQLLTESMLLALVGAVPGVLLAGIAVRELKRAAPSLLPRMSEISLDGDILLFAFGVTVASGLLFGTLPALRAVAGAARGEMRAGARAPTADSGTGRLRSGLVVAQIAIAVVLLVGATLLVRSARTLAESDVGFEPAGLMVLRVFPSEKYSDDATRLRLYEQLSDALARVPGVQRSSLVNHFPLSGAGMVTPVRTARATGPDDSTLAYYRAVSTDYLDTVGARPLRGRLLGPEDAYGTGVVVNSTLAHREWGDVDPVGRSITVFRASQGAAGFGDAMPGRVVGMIEDIRESGPDIDPPPTVYVPLERNVWTNITLVVRTAREASAINPSLRAAVSGVDPDIPVAGPGFVDQFRPLADDAAQSTATRRFVTDLLTAFAILAVVLSIVGLFGAMAYLVAQRTRELGIRMALGARPVDTAAMVVRQSVVLVGLGLSLGVAAAIPASRVLESLLFGVPRHDAVSYAAAAAVFLATGALAAYVPARRAARIQPVGALREG